MQYITCAKVLIIVCPNTAGMICANLLYGNLLKKCYGVEIIPELYEASVAVLDQFRKKVLNLDTSGGAVAAGGGGATEQEDCCLYAANRSCEMEVALGDILVEEFIAEWTSAGGYDEM